MQRSLNVGSDRLPVLAKWSKGNCPYGVKNRLKYFALKIRKFVRTFYETYDAYLIYAYEYVCSYPIHTFL